MYTVTLNTSQTTFVSSAQRDNNFSFYPLLYTGTDAAFQNCISFLKFDLSTLPVRTVKSALLRLAVIVKTGTTSSPIIVNKVTSPLDTATVTYNKRPTFVETPSQINISTADLYTSVQIDVTALVNQWLSGTVPNNGFALTNTDSSTLVEFATNNIVYEPYFPRLILTYPVEPHGPTGPTGPTGPRGSTGPTGPEGPPIPVSVNRIYVSHYTNEEDTFKIFVIDGNNNTVISTLTVGTNPHGIGVNTATNLIYVTNEDSNNISVIDGSTNTVISTITLAAGIEPRKLAVNPTTDRIYVTNTTNDLLVLDGSTNTITGKISIGSSQYAVGINPVTNRIYVLHPYNLSIIDGYSGRVIATIPSSPYNTFPSNIGINLFTNEIYISTISNDHYDTVWVVSGSANKIIGTITVGRMPRYIGVNPITNRAYVANRDPDNVSVIDGNTKTIIATVTVGVDPEGIAVNSLTNEIFVTNVSSGNVSVIDGNTDSVIATIQIAEGVDAIGINP